MKILSAVFLFLFTFIEVQSQNDKSNLIIGTYTNNCNEKGIYVYDFDAKLVF